MIYLFNLNNFVFNIPVNKFSLRIFRFNIYLYILIFSLFLILFITILFFIIFYRKKLNNFFSFRINIFILNKIFFIASFIIVLIILFFSTKFFVLSRYFKDSYITVKIIGYQWMWYYNYIYGIGRGINYFSNININFYQVLNLIYKKKSYLQEVDNKIILPVNKFIRLIFTSNDVIHSWFIPSLILKQDAIPGFYRDFYFKSENIGNYKGYCTELCGKYHSYMPVILKIISLISYKKWVLSFFYKRFLYFFF